IGSPQFLGSKEKSMACALRRYGVTDSGITKLIVKYRNLSFLSEVPNELVKPESMMPEWIQSV
ncbi:MAG: hypothetical protein P8X74_22755, partial [Reinekea sp.]